MIRHSNSGLKASVAWATIGLLLAAAVLHGCSPASLWKRSTRAITRPFSSDSSGAHTKTIGLAVIENSTKYAGEGLETTLQEGLTRHIPLECPKIRIVKPGDKGAPDFLAALPKTPKGKVDGFGLAMLAKYHGLQAVIRSGVIDIGGKTESRGLLWFRGTHYFVEIHLFAEIFDPETGAKIFDQSFVTEVEVDESEFETLPEKQSIRQLGLAESMDKLVKSMGETICESLSRYPWRGYVKETDGKRVILSSGSGAGLAPNQVMDIHAAGEIMKDLDKQMFLLPGKKIGEVQLKSVQENTAEAVLISGSSVKPGDVVIPRK